MNASKIIRTKTTTIQVRDTNAQYREVLQVPGNAKRIVGIVVSAKVCRDNVPMYIPRHVFFTSPTEILALPDTMQDVLAHGYVGYNQVEKPYTGKCDFHQYTSLVDQYLFYACPAQEGVPVLEINGQKGNFEDAITVLAVMDSANAASAQDYYVFRSTEKWTGNVEINTY